jgi:hypothetical protein
MKIPRRIKVAARWFRVRFPHLFNERADIFGRCDFNRGHILITNLDQGGNICSDEQTAIVFWHELFHLVDYTYCMNKIGQEFDKESLIDALAQGLVQILADNFEPLKPKAVCMLKGGKGK